MGTCSNCRFNSNRCIQLSPCQFWEPIDKKEYTIEIEKVEEMYKHIKDYWKDVWEMFDLREEHKFAVGYNLETVGYALDEASEALNTIIYLLKKRKGREEH